MARGKGSHEQESKAGAFFMATLVMLVVSDFFEIMFNQRPELLPILAGLFISGYVIHCIEI